MNNGLSNSQERGRVVIQNEAGALEKIAGRLGTSFDEAIRCILACKGKVVLTGMGKHGLIARKIAATLASTGTPSFFMHPGEALHGDLGMVNPEDVVLAVSNSGSTQEVLGCLPYFKHNGNTLIAMTGGLHSELAKQADLVLDIKVEREVCPMNLAPTTSTTAALVMGDALAVVLLEQRGFGAEDFAIRHPSGALGRLLRRVCDIIQGQQNPVVSASTTFGEAIAVITAAKNGAVSVVNDNGELVGILTDGDLRRTLQRVAADADLKVADLFQQKVVGLMTKDPMSIAPDMLAAKAINLMEDGPRKVLVLPVVDEAKRPVGMVHIHDLIS